MALQFNQVQVPRGSGPGESEWISIDWGAKRLAKPLGWCSSIDTPKVPAGFDRIVQIRIGAARHHRAQTTINNNLMKGLATTPVDIAVSTAGTAWTPL